MPTLTTPTYTDLGNTGPTGPQGPQGVKGDTGNTGARGVAGPSGPLGPIGLTPILDISSNTGAAGTSAIVTQTGTAANVNLLFTIPKGDKGDLGTIEANYYLTPGQPMFTLDPSNGNTFINGTLDVSGNSTFDKNLTINGILKAGALVVDSSEIATTDPVLQLGSNNIDDDLNRGISFKYFEDSSKTGFFGYDQADNTFVFRPVASDAVNTARFTGDYGTAKFGRVVVGNGTVDGIVESNGSTPLVLQADGNKAQITINDGTNGVINIEAPGTGQVLLSSANTAIPGILLNSSTVRVGKSNTNAAITTSGTSDLTLHTNNNTNSGNITIADGAGGNISLTPNGSGSVVISKADINGGAIDGTTIATSNITVGSGKTLDVSAGTLKLADNQISGDKVEGGTIASITISKLAGAMDCNSKAMTNVDINSGTIDGTVIGSSTSSTGAFTTLSTSGLLSANNGLTVATGKTLNSDTVNIDGGAIDGTAIGAISPSSGAVTSVNIDNIKVDGNSITSTDTNGHINITPNGNGSVIFGSHLIPSNPGINLGSSSNKFNNIYGNISGTVTGAASEVTLTTTNNNDTYYPTFAASASGDNQLYTANVGSGLTYNPNSNTLTTSEFVGALTGNADSVTNGVYTTDKISALSSTTSAELAGVISDETGTGKLVFATSPALVTPALGTPTSGVLTNCTGTASGLTAGAVTNGVYTTNNISALASTTSAELAGVISDETGTGNLVFATSPTLVTPLLGTPTSGDLTNCTGTASGLTAGACSGNAVSATTADRIQYDIPASTDAGTAGEIRYDANYIYVCTATGDWRRAALTGGY